MTDRPTPRPRLPAEEDVDVNGLPAGLAAFPLYLWDVDDRGQPTQPTDSTIRGFHLRPRRRPDADSVAGTLRHRPDYLATAKAGWSAARRRHHAQAMPVAIELARHGIIDLVAKAHPRNGAALGEISGWQLTPAASAIASQQADVRRTQRRHAADRAGTAAARLATTAIDCDPTTLIAALRRLAEHDRPHPTTADVLTAAADALARGVLYAGNRAFSQRHFQDSKLVDADRLMADAGVDKGIRQRLGVYRYGSFHIAGPITITNPTDPAARACLRGIPGPWSGPADPQTVALDCNHAPLVITENKDPAQHLSRVRPDLAVWFLSGYTGPTQLHMLAILAATASATVIITDADPDGVCIAGQVLAAVPHADLVDLGTHPHSTRARAIDTARFAELLTPIITDQQLPAALRDFASSVSTRGYEVEQDDLTTDVLATMLPPDHRAS